MFSKSADTDMLALVKRLHFPDRPADPPPDVPDRNIYIDGGLPTLGPKEIVENVTHGTGGWKSLQQAADETAEGERARKISERFDVTEIPPPVFDSEDWHL